VAAHLEPEILVVDEVLAVGDAGFQKKCLGKMGEVSKEGRTILFVSHNMAMISALCDTGLFLERGDLAYAGKIQDVIPHYYSLNQAVQGKIDYRHEYKIPGDEKATLLEVFIKDSKGEIKSDIEIYQDIFISMKYELLEDNMHVCPNIHIYSSDGTCAFVTSDSKIDPEATLKFKKGVYMSTCKIPANFLNAGMYFIGFALTSVKPSLKVHFYERDVLQLHIIDKIEGTITRSGYSGHIPGVVRPLLDWSCAKI
jgi:lipopolysaccharide transport system ATP-binding protein